VASGREERAAAMILDGTTLKVGDKVFMSQTKRLGIVHAFTDDPFAIEVRFDDGEISKFEVSELEFVHSERIGR
jgi:hypothetical protein